MVRSCSFHRVSAGPTPHFPGQLPLPLLSRLGFRPANSEGWPEGYAGPAVATPSAVSLNGVIASIGVQEFLFFVSGIRPVRTFTVYYMLEHELSPVVSRRVPTDVDCLACANKGIGDKAGVERYAQRVLSLTGKAGK